MSSDFIPPLRSGRQLARFVLVWFALSLGAAIASPWVKPQAMELICSGSGAIKLLIKSDGGEQQPSAHTLDCPLCAMVSAPPPVVQLPAIQPRPPSHAQQSMVGSAYIAVRSAAPLPPRGPPTFS